MIAGLSAAAALAAAGYVYWDYASHFEIDRRRLRRRAPVRRRAKVSGFVAEVPVTDNQHVDAGDLIARIDDRDYRVALAQAEAQVAAAQANIDNVDAQIAVQQAQIDQSQAQVEADRSRARFRRAAGGALDDLVQRGAGTVQRAQQYSSTLRQQQAAAKTARPR